jgi:hypothetical protein
MTRTSSQEPRQRRWKPAIAMLVLSAGFVAGGGALAPAQASAAVSDGQEICSPYDVTWFDQFCVDSNDGGGSGAGSGGGGGAGSGGGSGSGSSAAAGSDGRIEVIEIEEQLPKRIKVPLGARDDSSSSKGGDGGAAGGDGGPARGGRGKSSLPPCPHRLASQQGKAVSQDRKANCRPPEVHCQFSEGGVEKDVLVHSTKQCTELSRTAKQLERRPAYCKFLARMWASANEAVKDFGFKPMTADSIIVSDDPQIQDVVEASIRAQVAWEDSQCEFFYSRGKDTSSPVASHP